jgi:diacylglycerol kinase (ATP)
LTNALLVTNPAAGSADDQLRGELLDALRPAGSFEVVEPSDAKSFDEEVGMAARDAELVVVAGGDGTFNRTVNALRTRLDAVVLGLVPMGTGNDLARTLGVPQEPRAAAAGLASGGERDIDLGMASGPDVQRLFVNACMGGFPVQVDEETDEKLKRLAGPVAFWVAGAKAAANLRRSSVTINGVRVADCVAAGVGNGRTCGGGIEVWPHARPDDGVLEGCALPAEDMGAAAALALRVRSGRHEEVEGVTTCSARSIEISAEPDIEFNVDGELVGLKTPAIFELVGKLRFRLPTPSGEQRPRRSE